MDDLQYLKERTEIITFKQSFALTFGTQNVASITRTLCKNSRIIKRVPDNNEEKREGNTLVCHQHARGKDDLRKI